MYLDVWLLGAGKASKESNYCIQIRADRIQNQVLHHAHRMFQACWHHSLEDSGTYVNKYNISVSYFNTCGNKNNRSVSYFNKKTVVPERLLVQ